MNLLSHYVSAATEGDAFRLGAILPDLLRLFGRRPRPHHLMKFWREQGIADPAEFSPAIAQVMAGVEYHIQVDSLFHEAPLFTENARSLRLRLAAACDAPGLKRFFAAHLLVELYLDHLLIRERPQWTVEFYHLLQQGGADLFFQFTSGHEQVEPERMRGFLERIQQDRFVEDYATAEGLLYRVDRMLVGCHQRPLQATEKSAAIAFFHENAERVGVALLQFLQSVQQLKPRVATGSDDFTAAQKSGGLAPEVLKAI